MHQLHMLMRCHLTAPRFTLHTPDTYFASILDLLSLPWWSVCTVRLPTFGSEFKRLPSRNEAPFLTCPDLRELPNCFEANPASFMSRAPTCQVPCREPPLLIHLHSDVLIVPGWGRVPFRLGPMAADAPRGRLPRAVVLVAAAMTQGLPLVVGAGGVPAGGDGLGAIIELLGSVLQPQSVQHALTKAHRCRCSWVACRQLY